MGSKRQTCAMRGLGFYWLVVFLLFEEAKSQAQLESNSTKIQSLEVDIQTKFRECKTNWEKFQEKLYELEEKNDELEKKNERLESRVQFLYSSLGNLRDVLRTQVYSDVKAFIETQQQTPSDPKAFKWNGKTVTGTCTGKNNCPFPAYMRDMTDKTGTCPRDNRACSILRTRFNRFDANKDGLVDLEEAQRSYDHRDWEMAEYKDAEVYRNRMLPTRKFTALVKSMNQTGQAGITMGDYAYMEYLLMLEARNGLDGYDLGVYFNMLDFNKNGLLEFADDADTVWYLFTQSSSQSVYPNETDLKKYFDALMTGMDTNHDDGVDLEEFSTYLI